MTSIDDDRRGRRAQAVAGTALFVALVAALVAVISFLEPGLLLAVLPQRVIDQVFQDGPATAASLDQEALFLGIAATLILFAPAITRIWLSGSDRKVLKRWLVILAVLLFLPGLAALRQANHLHNDAASLRSKEQRQLDDRPPPCQVHSGSDDYCPGG